MQYWTHAGELPEETSEVLANAISDVSGGDTWPKKKNERGISNALHFDL